MGRVNAGGIFFSGGLAAVLVEPRIGSAMQVFSRFMGSGLFIGGLGSYMNKGNDK